MISVGDAIWLVMAGLGAQWFGTMLFARDADDGAIVKSWFFCWGSSMTAVILIGLAWLVYTHLRIIW